MVLLIDPVGPFLLLLALKGLNRWIWRHTLPTGWGVMIMTPFDAERFFPKNLFAASPAMGIM